MSPTAQLQAFTQSVYLTIKNRYYDDITGSDGQIYISQVLDWTNMFIDELENITDTTGLLVDWWFARQAGMEFGTVALGDTSIAIPSAVDRVLTNPARYMEISQGDIVISKWAVVNPKDMPNGEIYPIEDTCAVVGNSLIFSRALNATEDGGTLTADVTLKLPRLSSTNVKILTLVRPKQLIILGVAKNATLPDIVQGGLSPSYVQKYNDLLTSAMARSMASAQSSVAARDDFSGVRGIY